MIEPVSTPTDPPAVVVAFDFDGTLTTSDSVVPFLRRLVRPRALVRAVRSAPAAAWGIIRRDRDRLRAAATMAVLHGMPAATLESNGVAYAAELVATRLRADTTSRLAWHRASGHRVVLVSASYAVYLDHVAAALGIEAVLATRVEVVDGACTGRLLGDNCRGPEKVRRLEAWLDEHGLVRQDIVVWAYGDSSGDDELLAYADHSARVDGVVVTVAPTADTASTDAM